MATTEYGELELDEAARLLSQMNVSRRHAGYAEGEHVTVLARPSFDEGRGWWLLVTCQARAPQRIRWQRLAIRLEPAGTQPGTATLAFRQLDEHGQAWFDNLEPGNHGLRPLTCERIKNLLVRALLAHAAAPYETDGGESADQKFQTIPVYLSLDGSLKAQVLPLDAVIVIVFWTDRADLAGRTVEFAFFRDDAFWEHGIIYVKLDDGGGSGQGPFRAKWTGPRPQTGWETLLFTVLPAAPRRPS